MSEIDIADFGMGNIFVNILSMRVDDLVVILVGLSIRGINEYEYMVSNKSSE